MKRVILILLSLVFMIGVGYSQAPIKRKKEEKTEQTQPSATQRKREEEARRKQTTGSINGHEWVDLGLSVKWATCNVGASTPSDYGNYYAWGETTTKSSYTEENSLTYGKTMSELKSLGIINTAGNLTMSYDAARSNWGGTWRMPTMAELDELKSKCQWLWTTQGGYGGYQVTGPNGKSIFVPAAGWRDGTSLYLAGHNGLYWSSSCYDGSYSSYSLDFDSGGRNVCWGSRGRGFSVRSVSE